MFSLLRKYVCTCSPQETKTRDGSDNAFLYRGGTVKDKGIANVVVKAGIRKIDDGAFAHCHALGHVSIPDSVKSIGQFAFCDCKNLTTIAIPDGVKKVEEGTFACCLLLERIELPDSITSIGEKAFGYCESLRSIAIPKGLEEIVEDAFSRSAIESFVLPNGIKVIPYRAFFGCLLLKTLELPSSVKDIGEQAFDRCCNLENFVLPNGLPKLTKLNLNDYWFGVHGFHLISQLIISSPNLEELSLKNVEFKRTAESELKILNDDDILMLLQLVSLCPSLRTLNVSGNCFTPNVFETLTRLEIPGHLLRLKMLSSRDSWRNSEVETHHLLRVLEANPKLGIWTDQFWHESEDHNVRHHLEMNKYGCRGFTVPDPLWPLLIEKLAMLEMLKEKESQHEDRKEVDMGALNILYPLLRRHSELLA